MLRSSLTAAGNPVDLSGAIIFLASSASDYISGSSIVVSVRYKAVFIAQLIIQSRSMVASWGCENTGNPKNRDHITTEVRCRPLITPSSSQSHPFPTPSRSTQHPTSLCQFLRPRHRGHRNASRHRRSHLSLPENDLSKANGITVSKCLTHARIGVLVGSATFSLHPEIPLAMSASVQTAEQAHVR